jgi:hypothetical protein
LCFFIQQLIKSGFVLRKQQTKMIETQRGSMANSRIAINLLAMVIICASTQCLAISSRNFVDHSFTCPVSAICPQVCAPTVEDCPTHCKTNETICIDGSCIPDGTDCPLWSQPDLPCQSPCAPVVCAAVVASVPSCFAAYGPYYDAVANCQIPSDSETNLDENVKPELVWTNSTNVLLGIWVLLGTASIIAWCWYKYVAFVGQTVT